MIFAQKMVHVLHLKFEKLECDGIWMAEDDSNVMELWFASHLKPKQRTRPRFHNSPTGHTQRVPAL